MTKSELKAVADELRRLADRLEGTEKEETKEPEEQLSYTDIRKLLAEKSRAGHTAKIKELRIAHGADKLSEIDPKEYAALAREAEVL